MQRCYLRNANDERGAQLHGLFFKTERSMRRVLERNLELILRTHSNLKLMCVSPLLGALSTCVRLWGQGRAV